MDSEAARKQRLEELNQKRKRIEEMKRQRLEAEQAVSLQEIQVPTLVSPEPSPHIATSNVTTPKAVSVPESPPATQENKHDIISEYMRGKKSKLMIVKSQCKIDIFPSSPVLYDKDTQTEEDDILFVGNAYRSRHSLESEGRSKSHLGSPPQSVRKAIPGFGSPLKPPQEHAIAAVPQQRVYSEEERQHIMQNSEFAKFFGNASLFVERALEQNEQYDITKVYSVDVTNTAVSSQNKVFDVQQSYEEECVRGRPVMDMRWSPHVNELFLIAYGSKAPPPHQASILGAGKAAVSVEDEAPGLVCVWSREMHRRPEYKFTASSPVLVALFHSNEQHVVVGGCYSGQILLWDMRVSKTLPAQRSSMSGKGHKHPVYAMSMNASAASSNELISVSTDGLLCHWDLSRLAEPVSVISLLTPGKGVGSLSSSLQGMSLGIAGSGDENANPSGPINISSMTFGQVDASTSNVIFGSGSGQLLHSTMPYRPNDSALHQIQAHFGLVTAMHLHPNYQSKKFKNLLLTASLDWTVKLWNLSKYETPLFEFLTASYDYISDVQWSPAHNAVFTTISANGKLSLWNLGKSVTEPLESLQLFKDGEELAPGAAAASTHNIKALKAAASAHAALNKSLWSKDGQSVLIGDSQGVVHRVRIVSSTFSQNAADESKFEQLLASNYNIIEHTPRLTEEMLMKKLSMNKFDDLTLDTAAI